MQSWHHKSPAHVTEGRKWEQALQPFLSMAPFPCCLPPSRASSGVHACHTPAQNSLHASCALEDWNGVIQAKVMQWPTADGVRPFQHCSRIHLHVARLPLELLQVHCVCFQMAAFQYIVSGSLYTGLQLACTRTTLLEAVHYLTGTCTECRRR